jgi:hypothetical protein
VNPVALIAIAVAVALVVLLVVFYLRVYLRNHALGTPGLVSRVRLVCPKCHQTFDYDFIPGAAVTAIRLGTARFMACPLCHKWSTFDMVSNRLPATPREGPGTPPS